MNVKLLPVIIVGVAIGTLISAYVIYTVVSQKLATSTSSNSTLSLLASLTGGGR